MSDESEYPVTLAEQPSDPLDVSLEKGDEFCLVSGQLVGSQLQVLDAAAYVDDWEDGAKASRNATTERLHVQVLVVAVHACEKEAPRFRKDTRIGMAVLGHSLVRSLDRSHRSRSLPCSWDNVISFMPQN